MHIQPAKLMELAINGLDEQSEQHIKECKKCAKVLKIYMAVNTGPNYATDKQVEYCRSLFKKVKIYYKCIVDQDTLDTEILRRTGFDMKALTSLQAQQIIGKLKREKDQQRGFM